MTTSISMYSDVSLFSRWVSRNCNVFGNKTPQRSFIGRVNHLQEKQGRGWGHLRFSVSAGTFPAWAVRVTLAREIQQGKSFVATAAI